MRFEGKITKNITKHQISVDLFNQGDGYEKFAIETTSHNNSSLLSTLQLPSTTYHEEDIALMLRTVLTLLDDSKNITKGIHKSVVDVCKDFLEKAEEDELANSYVVGLDGRLKDDIVKE